MFPKVKQEQDRLGDRLEQIYTATNKTLDKKLDGLSGKVNTLPGDVKRAKDEIKSDFRAQDSKIRDIEKTVRDIERKLDTVIEKLDRVAPDNPQRGAVVYPWWQGNNHQGLVKRYGR